MAQALLKSLCAKIEQPYLSVLYLKILIDGVVSSKGVKEALAQITGDPKIADQMISVATQIEASTVKFANALGQAVNKICPNIDPAKEEAKAKAMLNNLSMMLRLKLG